MTTEMDAGLVELARQTTEAAKAQGLEPRPRADQEFGVANHLPFATPYQNAWEVLRGSEGPDDVTVQQLVAMRQTDGQARALYRLLTLPIRAALKTASFVEGDGEEGGEEEADFIRQMFTLPEHVGGMEVPFTRVMAQILMALFDGFAAFNLVYHVPETGPLKGKWTLKKMSYRPANTVTFLTDKQGRFEGLRQYTSHLGEVVDVRIPAEHAVYYAANEEERPFYGRSFFQSAFYHYDKKVRLYFVAHLAAQRAAVGTRVGKMPQGASKDEKQGFRTALAELGVAQYMALPPGYEVESLKEGGTFDFLALINHHNSQMSKSVLAAFFDKDQGGGQGDAKLVDFGTQSDALFILMLETIMGEIEALINSKVIPRFVDWNFDSGIYPEFKFGQLTKDQKQLVIDTFKTMAGQSVSPEFLFELEKKVADDFGLEVDYATIEAQREAQAELQREQTAALFGIAPDGAVPGAVPGQPGAPGQPSQPGAPGVQPAPAGGKVAANFAPPGFGLSSAEDTAVDLLFQAAQALGGGEVELARGQRKVRTQEGSRLYGQPIGAVITPDMVAKAEKVFGKAAVQVEEKRASTQPDPTTDPAVAGGPIKSVSTHPERPGARLLEFGDGTVQIQHADGTLSPRQKWDVAEFRQYGWGLQHQAGVPDTPGYQDPLAMERAKAEIKAGAKTGAVPGAVGGVATGSAKSPTTSETSAQDKQVDSGKLTPMTDEEYTEHAAKVAKTVSAAFKSGKSTAALMSRSGVWPKDRAARHDEIMSEVIAGFESVPQDRKGVIAGGLPGSGKSTVLAEHAGLKEGEWVVVNPDDFKDKLAEKGMVPEIEGLSPLEGAALIHDESLYLASRLSKWAVGTGRNVVFDITMSQPDQAPRRVEWMRKAGYEDVRAVFVDVPVETSVERTTTRHREGADRHRSGEGFGGRFIPAAIIARQARKGGGSYNRKNFESLQGSLDGWTVYDNSGNSPVEVATGKGAGTKSTASGPPKAEAWKPAKVGGKA